MIPDRQLIFDAIEFAARAHAGQFRKTSLAILLVICADKLDNIRSLRIGYAYHGAALWTHFSRPKAQQKWYYKSLADTFISRINGELSASMFRAIAIEVVAMFGIAEN